MGRFTNITRFPACIGKSVCKGSGCIGPTWIIHVAVKTQGKLGEDPASARLFAGMPSQILVGMLRDATKLL
jgi:hypothetical protein